MKTGSKGEQIVNFSELKPLIIDCPRLNLGESPVWWKERSSFVFTDINGNSIYLLNPTSLNTTEIKFKNSVVCIVPCDRSKLLLVFFHKICVYDIETNNLQTIFTPPRNKLGVRFNDGKCDKNGRFWVSGIGDQEEKTNSSIFIIEKDKFTIKEKNKIILGNGLDWNLESKKFFFTDSKRFRIYSYSFSKDPLNLSSHRSIFFEIKDPNVEPDGLYVDRYGNIWSCLWNAGKILQINQNGDINFEIKLPIKRPTSLAFGGSNLDIMLLTTAMDNESSNDFNGKCFLFKKMPFGLPTNYFKL